MAEVSTASGKLLTAIPHKEAILRSGLTKLRLLSNQVLVEQGQPTEHIYFIENGVAALLAQAARSATCAE